MEHDALDKVFEAHLLHDYENNLGTEGLETLDLPDLLVPEPPLVSAERTEDFRCFEPFDARRVFTVRCSPRTTTTSTSWPSPRGSGKSC